MGFTRDLDSCCFFCSLETGCSVIGVLGLVFGLGGLGMALIAPGLLDWAMLIGGIIATLANGALLLGLW